jgi:hypothetical protein
VLIANALLVFLFGVGLLFAPNALMSLFGILLGPTDAYLARLLGAATLGVGVLNWAARGVSDPAAIRALTLGNLTANGVGFAVTLLAQAGGQVNNLGWSVAAVFAFFTLGFGFFYLNRPDAS